MEKINYQLKTDEYIKNMLAKGEREKLLLHACCAPCSSYVLEYLSQYFNVTVFWCNPNITNKDEYNKRLSELYKLCGSAPFCRGVDIIEDAVPTEVFFGAAKGLEKEPEGGKRCTACFELRLDRTAEYAAANGFGLFTTTLTISPHKNARLINETGKSSAQKHGVGLLPCDFKKRGGYLRSIELCREYNIYRQHYCGCCFSEPD